MIPSDSRVLDSEPCLVMTKTSQRVREAPKSPPGCDDSPGAGAGQALVVEKGLGAATPSNLPVVVRPFASAESTAIRGGWGGWM